MVDRKLVAEEDLRRRVAGMIVTDRKTWMMALWYEKYRQSGDACHEETCDDVSGRFMDDCWEIFSEA